MRLVVVYDKKSGDMLAPQFVPSLAVAVRSFTAMAIDEPKSLFARFPEDYQLMEFERDVVEISETDKFAFHLKNSIDFSDFIEVNSGVCDKV